MRFDIIVKTTLTHLMAVEARDVFEAQNDALGKLGERSPDKVDTTIEIEVGNG